VNGSHAVLFSIIIVSMSKINISMETEISLKLLNNAFDLLFPCIDLLRKFDGKTFLNSDERELKTAFVLATIAVELLLKTKIASIHWTQIVQNPTTADKQKIRKGDFKSVKFGDCIGRIERISSIKFANKIKKDIEKIGNIRNKLFHFQYDDTNPNKFITTISLVLDVFIEFYRNYILNDYYEDKDRTEQIDGDLKNVKDYVAVRLATLKEKYKAFDKPKTYYFIECINCWQDAFILEDAYTVKCIFCSTTTDIKEMAESYSNCQNKIKTCPECMRESMAAIHSSEAEEEAWDCIICGHYIKQPQIWQMANGISSLDSVREEFRLHNDDKAS